MPRIMVLTCNLTAPHPFHAAKNKLSPCEKEGREKRDEDKERGNQVRKKEREKRGEKE